MKIRVPTLETVDVEYKTPGGNGGQGAVARTNATNAAMYANAQNELSYANAYAAYVQDETQSKLIAGIKDQTNAQQYKANLEARDIQIQGQLEAYQRNSQNVASQLDLNRQAAIRADYQAKEVFKDRLKTEEFKLREVNQNYSKQLAQDQYSAQQQMLARDTAQLEYYLQQDKNKLDRQFSLSNLEYEDVQQVEAYLERANQQVDRRNNLIRQYGEFTNQSQFQYNELGRQQSESESAQLFARESMGRELDRQKSLKIYEKDQLDSALDRFNSEKDFESESIGRQYDRFAAAKEFEKAVALQQFEDQRAQLMFQQEQRLFQQTQELGNQLSRGQRGKSAARGLRSISALAGVDLSRMADQIDRAEDAYGTQRDRADAEKTEQRTERDKRQARIGDQKTEQKDLTDDRKDRLDDVYSEQETEKEAKTKRSLAIDTEVATKTTAQKKRTQQRLDEKQKESLDAFNQSIDAEGRDHDRLLNARKQNENKQEMVKSTYSYANKASEIKRRSAVQSANDRLSLISRTTGVNADIFKMDRRAIGESMMSAMNAYESQKDDIYLKKYEADVKAYANRMFTPRFTSTPDAPFKTPVFEGAPPTRPIEVPRGSVAPRPEAPKQSGLSKVLAIGGMVLGAVAAPLTAGASIGAIPALAPAIVGGVGGGLSAASAFV